MNEALDTRPLFTVYARVAGAIVGFTTRGGYADAVAFMHATQAGRATPEPITQAEADARTTGGEYGPYMGEGEPGEYRAIGDVWLYIPEDAESAEYEANTYTDGCDYRIEWYHTGVGLVRAVHFLTLAECYAWYASNGYADYTA
jgi:hypothetical protein